MIRLLLNFGVFVVSAALGLIAAALILPGVTVSVTAFAIDVLTFAVLRALLSPLVLKATVRNAPAIAGATGLISTILALIVTTVLSDGLVVRGASTWLLAALIIWLVSMLASFLLPVLVVKRILRKLAARKGNGDGAGIGNAADGPKKGAGPLTDLI